MDATTLHLVRHGSTVWSDAGRINGTTDVALNDNGRRQAEKLRERFRGKSFAGVWASDLARARQTAEIAWGSATVDPRLREFDFGRLEGSRWNELDERTQQALVAFDGFRAPEGEDVDGFGARIAAFVAELHPGEHLIFTHGGVIRWLMRGLDRHDRVAPGSVVVIDGPGFHRVGVR